jgi:hypothetical protein
MDGSLCWRFLSHPTLGAMPLPVMAASQCVCRPPYTRGPIAAPIEFVALGKMSTEDRRDKELIRWIS